MKTCDVSTFGQLPGSQRIALRYAAKQGKTFEFWSRSGQEWRTCAKAPAFYAHVSYRLVDEAAEPATFGSLLPSQQQQLKSASKRGVKFEYWSPDTQSWRMCAGGGYPIWSPGIAYRAAPDQEYGSASQGRWTFGNSLETPFADLPMATQRALVKSQEFGAPVERQSAPGQWVPHPRGFEFLAGSIYRIGPDYKRSVEPAPVVLAISSANHICDSDKPGIARMPKVPVAAAPAPVSKVKPAVNFTVHCEGYYPHAFLR